MSGVKTWTMKNILEIGISWLLVLILETIIIIKFRVIIIIKEDLCFKVKYQMDNKKIEILMV